MTRGNLIGALEIFDLAGRRMAPVLARWRRELGWTQQELATRAGVSRGYLSRLERGLPGRPGLEVLSRVCGAMGHSWAELYAAAGLGLPGDVTLDQIAAGINDPELLLYLRRLPELDLRDRALLRGVLRAFFERESAAAARTAVDARQLGLPAFVPLDRRTTRADGDSRRFSPDTSK